MYTNIDREILFRFFNRTATNEEENKIREWVEEADENYRLLLEERKFFDAVLLHGDVSYKKQYSRIPLRKIALRVAGIAAVVALTIALTTLNLEQGLREAPLNKITVPQGQRVNLTLSDGTNVWLNTKTRMEYPQSFKGADKRIVRVNGEAYFEVSKNANRPFIVETSKGKVEVLGTKFYVNAYEHTDDFEISLIEGSVKVLTANDNMILSPNHKAVLQNKKLHCRNIEDTDAFRWRDGLFCFKDLPFDEVLKLFETYYDVSFVKENEKIPNIRMNGKFRLVDGVDYALRVLQKEVRFSFSRDHESNVIYLK
ncbi:iron dicitrate transport regulator FecR [Bacteroides heparinolyticus]|uniref:FecR family protein n=1 Tax=Prevotella heparinolytica TaxID=28113 RepID=A0A2R3MSH0_9BACE|nr:FecR domain-containing protein [Bacteroides heparinolyticus]AVM57890.1 iron dicitrate transport regulator FecR [Bacteroides heparinolyticus]TCO94936.1 FecR family protein [Bacteroides heparinolyticus]